jgi:hypothetical protein
MAARHRGRLAALLADLAAEVEELVEGDPQLVDVAAEVFPEHLGREDVDARGHRRVRREDVARRRDLPRLGEAEALLLHEAADLLERHERRVALVDVADRGIPADLLERSRSADAEHDLLLEPHLVAAPVEPLGHLPVRRLVLGQVRVEQEERHAAHASEPDHELHRAAGQRDGDGRRRAVRRFGGRERQVVRLEDRIGLGLPALGVQELAEVAFVVEEADAHERHPHVARGLEEVPRQDAEASRVDRQALGQAELGREVATCPRQQLRAADGGLGEVLSVSRRTIAGLLLVGRILGPLPQLLGGHPRKSRTGLPRTRLQASGSRNSKARAPRAARSTGGHGTRRRGGGASRVPRYPKGFFEDGRQLAWKCSRALHEANRRGQNG